MSSFVQAQFKKKFKKVLYDDDETYSSDDDYDFNLKSNINIQSISQEDNSSDDEDSIPNVTASGKSQFHGMRVFDTVCPSLRNSYFHVKIDGNKKYIHKQTACWLLTDDKASLSADRLKRVQQSSR